MSLERLCAMERADMLNNLAKLNAHYKLKIGWHDRHGRPKRNEGPHCLLEKQCVSFPRNPVFYDLRILAHEFAHFLTKDAHNSKKFEAAYRECCLILDVPPTPHNVFGDIVWKEYYKSKDKRTTMICPKCRKKIDRIDVMQLQSTTQIFYLDEQGQPVYEPEGEPPKDDRWYSCPECGTTIAAEEGEAIRLWKGLPINN